MKTTIINNVQYELEQHDNGKMLKDIKIPEGWRLLLPSEAMMLYERRLIDSSFWFFVMQTNEEIKRKGNVARFGADSDGAGLNCGRNPADADASLGIIFCRDLKGKHKDTIQDMENIKLEINGKVVYERLMG